MSANGYNRPGTSPLSNPHSTISGNDFSGQYTAFDNCTGLDSLLQICAVVICKKSFCKRLNHSWGMVYNVRKGGAQYEKTVDSERSL